MNVNLCDQCKERIGDLEMWHVEQTAPIQFGYQSGPFDFCSLACLSDWSTDLRNRQAASVAASVRGMAQYKAGE